jgi:hypothetical protein
MATIFTKTSTLILPKPEVGNKLKAGLYVDFWIYLWFIDEKPGFCYHLNNHEGETTV